MEGFDVLKSKQEVIEISQRIINLATSNTGHLSDFGSMLGFYSGELMKISNECIQVHSDIIEEQFAKLGIEKV